MSNAQKQPQDIFYKKSVLTSFKMFTGKYLCRSLFLNKVAGLSSTARPSNLLKKDTPTLVFSYQYCEILKNTYFEEHLQKAASEYGLNCIWGIQPKLHSGYQ